MVICQNRLTQFSDDSASIVLPPIRDISLATKHRLSENEDYDKEDSADRNRPPLPRLNTQTRKHPDIDASRDRHAFSSRRTSPVNTPSFSMSLTQHSPESSSRVHAAGLISDTTSSSSDLYPSPRERESYLSDFNTQVSYTDCSLTRIIGC